MSEVSLPQQFEDLEPLAAKWSLPTERARNQRRLSSTMDEIRQLYETVFPRMEAILEYLERFPVTDMTPELTDLFNLGCSVAEVATAVENYANPSVIDGFDPARLVFCHEEGSGR